MLRGRGPFPSDVKGGLERFMSHINSKKPCTKRIVNLGVLRDSSKSDIAPDARQIIVELEAYLRYTLRLSDDNIAYILRDIRYLYKRYDLSTLNEETMRGIEEDMRNRGLQNSTIRLKLVSLKYLAKCRGLELEYRMPRRVARQPQSLNVLEARGLLEACTTIRDRAIIAVLLYCGLRNKELCALNVEDVDLEGRLLHVRDRGGGIKNRRERTVVMTGECARLLGEWVRIRPRVEERALFLTTHGGRLGKYRLSRLVEDLGRRAGLDKPCYPHLLRHTCASMMLRSGVPLTDVMVQLGHHSLSTTMVYLHTSQAMIGESLRKFKY